MPTDPNPPVEFFDTENANGLDENAYEYVTSEDVNHLSNPFDGELPQGLQDTTVTGAGPGTDNVDHGHLSNPWNNTVISETFDTEYASGGEETSDNTIDQEETVETTQVSEPYLSFKADPSYTAPTQQPGVSIFDSTATLAAPTTGASLRSTVNTDGTQDSYLISAIPVESTSVPSNPDSPYIQEYYRGVIVYWNPAEDLPGAPVLGYTVRLSDGTTHRFGRDDWLGSWYFGKPAVVECQSSVPVTATIEAFNANGTSEPSGQSNEAIPFNADETGYGMFGRAIRDVIGGIYDIDGTVKAYTGAPTAPSNVTVVSPAADQLYLAWSPARQGAGAEVVAHHIVVTDENNLYYDDWYYVSNNYYLFNLDTSRKWHFYVIGMNDDGLSGDFASTEFIPVNNDDFGHAILLAPGFKSVVGNNNGFTVAPYEPFYNDYDVASAWYVWTAPDKGFPYDATDFNTNDPEDNSFDTVLIICTGPNVQNLEIIDTDDDGGIGTYSNIIFYPEPGVTYYIRVAGYNEGDSGRFVLNGPYYPDATTITDISAGDGSIYVQWADFGDSGNPQLFEYAVYLYDGGDLVTGYPIETDNNDITLTDGVVNDTAYTVKVATVSSLTGLVDPVFSDESDPVTPVFGG